MDSSDKQFSLSKFLNDEVTKATRDIEKTNLSKYMITSLMLYKDSIAFNTDININYQLNQLGILDDVIFIEMEKIYNEKVESIYTEYQKYNTLCQLTDISLINLRRSFDDKLSEYRKVAIGCDIAVLGEMLGKALKPEKLP